MDLRTIILPASIAANISDNESITKILTETKSSHDLVLVHDTINTYAGIAYVYNMLYRLKPNVHAKVKSVLLQPPKISYTTPIPKILLHMYGMRLYMLPLTNEADEVTGIVTAKRIIQSTIEDGENVESFPNSLLIREPLLINESTKIKDIYSTFRKQKISRAVIQSNDGFASGVLTRRDIYLALLSPERDNRFRTQGGLMPSSFFNEDWITQLDYPASAFMTTPVQTIPEDSTKETILTKLLSHPGNSVVLTDGLGRPTGVVTTRSVIACIIKNQPSETVPYTVVDKNKILSDILKHETEEILKRITQKIALRTTLSRTEVIIEPIRQNPQAIKMYDVKLVAYLTNGKSFQSKKTDFRLRAALHECEDRILRQLDNFR